MEYENLAMREAQQKKGGASTKRKLQKGGVMTAEQALARKRQKAEARIQEDMAKQSSKERKIFNKVKGEAYKSGVAWRKMNKKNKQVLSTGKASLFPDLVDTNP